MKSVGEAMAIGRTFKQAFSKALRSRELDSPAVSPDDDGELLELLAHRAQSASTICSRRCAAAPGCRMRRRTQSTHGSCTSWRSSRGSRRRRSRAADIQGGRHLRGGVRRQHALLLLGVGASAALGRPAHEVERGERESVVILGSGPNRIGQGIEFDYCCVHAAQTVRESGRDAVMINCNPETVSTDYDTSDRLYFEPLTLDDVLAVCELERRSGWSCSSAARRR